MHYRRLGRSGLKVSEISLGTWLTFGNHIDEKQSKKLIHAAFEQGINYFDSADINANGKADEILGRAIADLPRTELVLSSKVFYPTSAGPNGRGLSRKHIVESLNATLRRLDTEDLDLYFCHRYDPDTSIDEVVRTMDLLIRQGKILYWGTSEWEPFQITQAYGVARELGLTPPAMEQPQYNMFERGKLEDEYISVGNGSFTYIASATHDTRIMKLTMDTVDEADELRQLINKGDIIYFKTSYGMMDLEYKLSGDLIPIWLACSIS